MQEPAQHFWQQFLQQTLRYKGTHEQKSTRHKHSKNSTSTLRR
jgi:hypothetical protein